MITVQSPIPSDLSERQFLTLKEKTRTKNLSIRLKTKEKKSKTKLMMRYWKVTINRKISLTKSNNRFYKAELKI